jgi:glycosyltransferase involved in cell wall biosynthesis
MDLSVILCTYNRAALLQRSLESLRRQVVSPNVRWELIVVDNNCSDSTPEILRDVSVDFPVPLQIFRETKQGLSHARNRGIKEAQGTYLLFTDDDVEPALDWIESIWSTFRKCQCDAVGGKVELKFLCERPLWVTDDLKGFLAHVDYGSTEIQLTGGSAPIGANMAYSARVFARLGGFDPLLGMNADKLVGGEEIDLFERFLKASLIAIYQPKALVYHAVDRDRLRKSYFRSLHFNSGKIRGLRYVTHGRQVFGIPLFLLPQLLRSLGVFAITVLKKGLDHSVRLELNIWYFLGFIFGCAGSPQGKGRVSL